MIDKQISEKRSVRVKPKRERSAKRHIIALEVIVADRVIVRSGVRGSDGRGASARSQRSDRSSRDHVETVCRSSGGALRRRRAARATPGPQQHAARAVLHRQDIRQVRRQRSHHV